jgi:hypothetical protein
MLPGAGTLRQQYQAGISGIADYRRKFLTINTRTGENNFFDLMTVLLSPVFLVHCNILYTLKNLSPFYSTTVIKGVEIRHQ